VYAVVQQFGPCLFFALWFGGSGIFFLRSRAAQVAYLKKFPLVNGVPLEMFMGGNPFGPVARAIARVSRTRQTVPELERLRQKMRRRSWHLLYWMWGFPVLGIGVGALLMLTIFPH
jgi:hypothetical protein